jgi:hypothetical protein
MSELVVTSETYRPDLRLFIRIDERGLSVMSTECTYDLSPLRLVDEEGERLFISDFSESRYSLVGEVISGPQRAPLPFFKARLAPGLIGGLVPDTLFVELGELNEVGSDWRLPLKLVNPK